jgi:glucose-6-phosphate isomerase
LAAQFGELLKPMSRIMLDFTNCLAEAIGATHGLTKAEMDTLVTKIPEHHKNIDELRTTGACAFFDLPYENQQPLKELLKKHHGKWDNVVIIAVGGSSLAARCLIDSLAHSQHNSLDAKVRKNAPRVFYANSPDPTYLQQLLDVLDIKKSLFVLVSKSGATSETLAVWLWLVELIKKKSGKSALSQHAVIISEHDKSPLHDFAKQEKIDTLPIQHNLPGRYGVLGNAGLFAAGLCGIDYELVLAGAADMDKRCRQGDAYSNPAYMHALIHYLLTRKRRKTMHATYAFSHGLYAVSLWYAHLNAVSLGKMLNRKGKAVHVGPSPVTALGPNDQHGHMQLFSEGPYDKVLTYITAENYGPTLAIPAHYPKWEAAQHLAHSDGNSLMHHAYRSSEYHITQTGRPNMTIRLDDITPHSVGGLIYLLQLSTVMSAELYGIDPFDQPGVELGKQAIFAQNGRPGFEDLANRIATYRAKPRRTC